MRSRRRSSVRASLAAVFAAVLLLSACAQEIALPDDADEELILGSDIYRASCARCHGADGGGGIGRSLRGVDQRLTVDEQIDVVLNGRNQMPRFSQTLTESDIEAVVRYQREILSGTPE